MKVITQIARGADRGRGLTIVWGRCDASAAGLDMDMTIGLCDTRHGQGLCWLGLDLDDKNLRRHWPQARRERCDRTARAAGALALAAWRRGIAVGKLDMPEDMPLVLHGTAFQIAVWRVLLKIPFGRTRTYGDVAAAVGRPSGFQATGRAVGANPVSVIVPCHRVVNRDPRIENYAWGAAAKRTLLTAEGYSAP